MRPCRNSDRRSTTDLTHPLDEDDRWSDQPLILCAVLLGLLASLGGCVAWEKDNADGTVTRHVLGYTKVRHPRIWSSGQPPQISETAELGISFGCEGVLVGRGDRTVVSLPPGGPGYLVFDVRSEEDLQRLIHILEHEELKEYPLCVTIDAIEFSKGSSVVP